MCLQILAETQNIMQLIVPILLIPNPDQFCDYVLRGWQKRNMYSQDAYEIALPPTVQPLANVDDTFMPPAHQSSQVCRVCLELLPQISWKAGLSDLTAFVSP